MESANNLQHQLQELFVGYSSLASSAPPKAPSITHDFDHNIILDGNTYNNPYFSDHQTSLLPFSRLNESNNPWFNFSSTYQQPNEQQQLSAIYSSHHVQSPATATYGGFHGMAAGFNLTNDYNHKTSTSTLDLLSSSSFSSYNLQNDQQQHLDHMISATNYSAACHRNGSLFGYGHQHDHHVQDSINSPANSSTNKISSSVGRAKRPPVNNSFSVPKKSNSESKKPCSSSRSSCPPLKIRKEKLGDRISALQRLVAPFGKTDTSSVLTEAIGYIQFLHDQVEILSMSSLKSSQNKPYQKLHPSSSAGQDGTRPKQDLRSRGLCLMPLSYVSFIHGYD